jgi:putative exosortase-associated protein (TIGR04073 family)
MRYLYLGVAALLFLGPVTVFGQDYGEADNPGTKLAYGVTEVAFSWTEIPKSVYHYSEKYDPVSGLFLGIGEGTVLGLQKCAEGVVDTATFLVPPYETKGKSFFKKLSDWDKKVQERFW